MESKKYNKLVNITTTTKKSRLINTENKLVVTSRKREEGKGKIRVGDKEVQTVRYKISYKNLLYNTGNIANIYNDYKWSKTFKNCESLCYTPVTHIILYSNYNSVKKKERENPEKAPSQCQ